jgi:hypothetical protein
MTRRFAGQILRIVGLLIEMFGIMSLGLRSRGDEAGGPLGGLFSMRGVWILVAIGFAIWLVGSVLTYWPQRSLKKTKMDLDGHVL